MDYTRNSFPILAILSLSIASIVYLCTWAPLASKTLLSLQKSQFHQSKSLNLLARYNDELEKVLRATSMASKTMIITIVNKAYTEPNHDEKPTVFDLFLEGFWEGEGTKPLLDHVLVVAMDEPAYQRCRFRRLHCYKLKTDGVDFSGEKIFMSEDFIRMMWRRTQFLLDVLKRGYNFIFTDTDVMWLRNPFGKLNMNGMEEDLQISTDQFNGHPDNESNSINTGFYYVKSNNKTIALFQKWYGMRNKSKGMKEQDVLAILIHKGFLRTLGIKTRFLDTDFFSGFCANSKDVRAVITVHANCCRSIEAKVIDLSAVLRDWKGFRSSIAAANNSIINATSEAMRGNGNSETNFSWSKHIACKKSWKKAH